MPYTTVLAISATIMALVLSVCDTAGLAPGDVIPASRRRAPTGR